MANMHLLLFLLSKHSFARKPTNMISLGLRINWFWIKTIQDVPDSWFQGPKKLG